MCMKHTWHPVHNVHRSTTLYNLDYIIVYNISGIVIFYIYDNLPHRLYDWLRMASRSYEDTEREVSQKFGRTWHLLSDEEFKRLTANQLTADYSD